MAYTGKLQLFRGVPLDIGGEDTFYFESRNAQTTYFDSLATLQLTFGGDKYKFIRENGYIKVNASHDFLENCNYLRYQNEDLSGMQATRKWYYAFITKIEYISDTTTGIYFTIDALQTWLPNIDYNVNECFVERMHTAEDSLGSNLATETIKSFKNKTYEESTFDLMSEGFYIAILFTYQKELFSHLDIKYTIVDDWSYDSDLGTVKMDGTVTGSNVVMFEANASGLAMMRKAIKQGTILEGNDYIKAESITDIYIVPKKMLNGIVLCQLGSVDNGVFEWYGWTFATRRSQLGSPTEEVRTGLSSPVYNPNFELLKIGTYTPKNKKLLSSQYTNYQIVNVDGNVGVLEPEGFKKETGGSLSPVVPKFSIMASALPPAKIMIKCLTANDEQYYGAKAVNEQIFPLGELPSVSISIDTYKNWLARQTVQKIQTVVSTGVSLASAVDGGMYAMEMLNNIYSKGQFYDYEYPKGFLDILYSDELRNTRRNIHNEKANASQAIAKGGMEFASSVVNTNRPVPICAGNGNNAGSTMLSHDLFKVSFRKYAPVESELERIDNYFTAYGYAINTIAVPNLKVRTRFTYVKTKGARNTPIFSANNTAGIPTEYMREINGCFNAGIRFWVGQDISNLTTLPNDIIQ